MIHKDRQIQERERGFNKAVSCRPLACCQEEEKFSFRKVNSYSVAANSFSIVLG